MRSGRTYNDMENNIENNKSDKRVGVETKHIIKMLIWMIIAMFIIYQCYKLLMYTLGKEEKEKMWLYNSVNSFINIFVKNDNKSVTEEHTLKVAGLGDIYITQNMLTAAKNGTEYDFSKGAENIKKELEKFDIVFASLSTPVADKEYGYTTKSTYNAPIDLLSTLKELNIAAVATATDHAMDKKEKGILSTIENLKESSIEQVGINSSEEKNKPLVMSKNEIKIGLLSYATKSNIKISDEKSYLVNMLDEDDVKKDIEYLKSQNVDYIIAYLNDPNDNSILTSGKQKQNVELLFNNGVNVVLGTGSMVVQGQVEDQIQINEETTNHIYSIYCLGDFFGSYATDENRASVIANIEFNKKIKKNKKGEIESAFTDMKINTPLFVWTTLSTKNIKTMYVMENEINAYNNDLSELSAKEYNKLVSANDRLKSLFE